jgi:cyclophilin family peptidyl-prolyl cis-trans isomerase
MRILISLLCCLPLLVSAADNPRVVLETTEGDITLELYADKAPASVENFLAYVRNDHYDGTIFHRVIPNFMIQGGGFDKGLRRKSTREPIRNEADNGLANLRGSVAMARTSEPHSATAQFFINTVDNSALDHTGTDSPRAWGYAVFGKVVDGMAVVDRIESLETKASGGMGNLPVNTVVIQNVSILENEDAG